MIQVLQNEQSVEATTEQLKSWGLPTHITVQKNWDQWLLHQMVDDRPKDVKLLDLGCGDCCTLDFLNALKFSDLQGIDLRINSAAARPYQLHEGDMTQTAFPDAAFHVAVSISVIEHGVNLTKFFQEAYRLLKPAGQLFVTTDYWREKIPVENTIRPFDLPWQIFSKDEIQTVIALAAKQGFQLGNSEIPECNETPVSWYGKDYTFIALTFKKPGITEAASTQRSI